jgi:hypothetical protein
MIICLFKMHIVQLILQEFYYQNTLIILLELKIQFECKVKALVCESPPNDHMYITNVFITQVLCLKEEHCEPAVI